MDTSSQFDIGEVAEDEQGADQAPVFEQAASEGVVAAAGLELGEQQGCGGVAELERGAET